MEASLIVVALLAPLVATAAGAGAPPPPALYDAALSAHSAGQYDEARRLLTEALTRPDDLPVDPLYAQARLGLALRLSGHPVRARHLLDAVIAVARLQGKGDTEALARRYRGRLRQTRGDLPGAAEDYRLAGRWFDAHGPPVERLRMHIATAALAYDRGDLAEAYRGYADALQGARDVGAVRQEEVALLGVAYVLADFGDAASASALAGQAEALAVEAGAPWRVTRARAYRALTLLAAGRWDAARRLATAVLAALPAGRVQLRRQAAWVIAQSDLYEGAFEAALEAVDARLAEVREPGPTVTLDDLYFTRAEALLDLGRLDEAEAAVDRGMKWARAVRRRARGAALQARIADERGDEEAAIRGYELFDRLDGGTRATLGPGARGQFVGRVRRGYRERLIELDLDAGRVEAAATIVSRLKSWALADQLVYRRRAGGPVKGRVAWTAARRAADEAHLVAVRRAAPSGSASAEAGRLATALPADVAVLDYYVLPRETVIFAYHGGHVEASRVSVGHLRLEDAVHRLTEAVVRRRSDYRAPAQDVAGILVAPVADRLRRWRKVRRLGVVLHGPLHALSPAMLPYGTGDLIDAFDVFQAPSLPALVALLGEPADPVGADPRVVVAGDAEGDLPGAAASARRTASRFRRSSLLLGGGATETAVRRLMPGADVVHLAVHGRTGEGAEPAYLQLRSGAGHDGRLHADELLGLNLSASLVVLSACESGVGQPNRGDEMLDVLDRAALVAGASAVISTAWRINDRSAARFMARFYDELPKRGRLGAFAAAQRALRRSGPQSPAVALLDGPSRARPTPCDERGLRDCTADARSVPLSHPYHWAAFRFTGDFR